MTPPRASSAAVQHVASDTGMDADARRAFASLLAQPAVEKVSGRGCIVPDSGGDSSHGQRQSGGGDAVKRRLVP